MEWQKKAKRRLLLPRIKNGAMPRIFLSGHPNQCLGSDSETPGNFTPSGPFTDSDFPERWLEVTQKAPRYKDLTATNSISIDNISSSRPGSMRLHQKVPFENQTKHMTCPTKWERIPMVTWGPRILLNRKSRVKCCGVNIGSGSKKGSSCVLWANKQKLVFFDLPNMLSLGHKQSRLFLMLGIPDSPKAYALSLRWAEIAGRIPKPRRAAALSSGDQWLPSGQKGRGRQGCVGVPANEGNPAPKETNISGRNPRDVSLHQRLGKPDETSTKSSLSSMPSLFRGRVSSTKETISEALTQTPVATKAR